MGVLNIDEKRHFTSIKRRLRRRGLHPILDTDGRGETEWEVHGPHEGMNYQVYIGPVFENDENDYFYVVMYPRFVYEGDDWHQVEPEEKIPVL